MTLRYVSKVCVLFLFCALVLSIGFSCAKEANNKAEIDHQEKRLAKDVKAEESLKDEKTENEVQEAEGIGEAETDETGAEETNEVIKEAEVAGEGKDETINPKVLIETSMGNIKVELFKKEAPISVKNFLDYASEKFYEGTIFHRVIPNFVIQGGGFTPDMNMKHTRPSIKNEAANALSNQRGTLSMARTQVVDSATSQFYINLKDNKLLDHRDDTPGGFGYCVFGRVVEGMDVVDKIAGVQTSTKGRYSNVPVTPVLINSVRVIE